MQRTTGEPNDGGTSVTWPGEHGTQDGEVGARSARRRRLVSGRPAWRRRSRCTGRPPTAPRSNPLFAAGGRRAPGKPDRCVQQLDHPCGGRGDPARVAGPKPQVPPGQPGGHARESAGSRVQPEIFGEMSGGGALHVRGHGHGQAFRRGRRDGAAPPRPPRPQRLPARRPGARWAEVSAHRASPATADTVRWPHSRPPASMAPLPPPGGHDGLPPPSSHLGDGKRAP